MKKEIKDIFASLAQSIEPRCSCDQPYTETDKYCEGCEIRRRIIPDIDFYVRRIILKLADEVTALDVLKANTDWENSDEIAYGVRDYISKHLCIMVRK